MSPKPQVKGGTWTRVAIFIALYTLLLESLIEWVLVIYLYATQRVDSKMMPSLILALAAPLCTVPLVVLHSLTAWQYNKVAGRASQKIILNTCCVYLLRLSVAVWLACSVAGLVVVAQHASCLPEDTNPTSFWNAGFSCELHRTVFIVSVVSFLTICVFFCSRELCDRPYDVSILGVYEPQPTSRDESILSKTSWDSECTLKNDVVCLCRHDGASGHYCQWVGDVHTCRSVKHPAPKRPKPALTIITRPDADCATLSCKSVSRGALEDMNSPVSWTPTVIPSPQVHACPAELSTTPTTPNGHKRAKSSLSSLKKRLIPKAREPFLPLSADPQIRALSDASQREKQTDLLSTRVEAQHQMEKSSSTTPGSEPRNSSDAPEVVPQEQSPPRKASRAYTSNIPLPPTLPINHPHHPNYIPPYPRPPSRTQSLASTQTQPQPRNTPSPAPNYYSNHNPEKPRPRQGTCPQPQPPRNPNQSFRRSQTNPSYPGGLGHGPRSQIQRTSLSLSQGHGLAQSQSQGQSQSQNFYAINRHRTQPPPRRSSTQRVHRNSSYNDVEIVYSSTRRSRSSTGYTNLPRRLDSITEVPVPPVSGDGDGLADEGQSGQRQRESVDGSVYRGADRTSLCNGI